MVVVSHVCSLSRESFSSTHPSEDVDMDRETGKPGSGRKRRRRSKNRSGKHQKRFRRSNNH